MEKLKLKDAIDKFLKEGEYELIDENLIGENAKEIIINMVKDAFQKGAEWMLEKTAYWLQEHVNNYLFDDGVPGRPWLKCKSDMFDDFRKAMEE